MMMLVIGYLNQNILAFCLDLMHDNFYQNQANRRKARVHTLYPPFGGNENKKTNRSNKGEKKGVLISMINSHRERNRHGKNADAKSAFKAMTITPIFEAWRNKNAQ
jgi:hypothetical protein